MFSFSDDERAYLTEMRGITTDSSGREILVGLTLDETAFYIEYARASILGLSRDQEQSDRYLELHEKHERARLAILAAENQLRVDNPQRH